MTDHEIKIAPEYYDAILRRTKRFEIRKNDRNYKVGDSIHLREWDGHYTWREGVIEITYVLTSEEFPEGIQPGYCVFGFNVAWMGVPK